MKKIIFIAIAFISLSAIAQKRGHQNKGGEKDKAHMFKDMSSEEVATLQTKKMTLDLNLNEAQQRDIYKIELANAEKRKAKHEERKKARENNKKEKPSSEEKFAKMNNLLDNKIAHKNEMRSILNDEQFQKWEQTHKRKGAKRKRKMRRSKRSK